MQNKYMILVMILFVQVVFGCSVNDISSNVVNEKAEEVQVYAIEEEHVYGYLGAPIEMIEYSDFECPYSEIFHNDIYHNLKEQYILLGKVKLIYRHLPLNSVHPNAHKAAEAAECAGMQGKFFQMHDMLFERGVEGGVESFKEYAAEIGLDTEKFNDCIDSDFTRQEVIDDFNSGIDLGVTGTPSFIVNGEIAPQMRTVEEFREYLDGLLEQ
ncbi:MAG: DsbA family protein [Nanoarchaeota archaeon]|nr:DsbA family protein [Nanoarchaeota archaeon]